MNSWFESIDALGNTIVQDYVILIINNTFSCMYLLVYYFTVLVLISSEVYVTQSTTVIIFCWMYNIGCKWYVNTFRKADLTSPHNKVVHDIVLWRLLIYLPVYGRIKYITPLRTRCTTRACEKPDIIIYNMQVACL